MVEALLDLLLVLVLSRAFWKLVAGVISGLRTNPSAGRTPQRGVQMARDPVCGTFVVPDHAVVLSEGRRQTYFCSTTCRDQYRARTA
jgi:YHS domain-containing protein